MRGFLRMQRAEVERRQRSEAGLHQLGTPRSSAAADDLQDYAFHGAEHQTGFLSLHPQVRCGTSRR